MRVSLVDRSERQDQRVASHATLTHGAFPILVDLDSKDLPASLLDQIELVGSSEGWTLENAYGQISVYRRDAAEVGKFGDWEWTGATGDGKWSTAGNWQGGTSPAEKLTHVFGASDKTGIDHDGTSSGGTTVGSIVFQTNAVMSYTISNKQMTYSTSDAITSYSWVPQCLKTGLRMTGGDRKLYANSVGPIYLAAGKDMDIKDGGTGAYMCYGDVRLGCKTTGNVQTLKFAGINRAFPSFRTAMTVVSGGDIKFNKQTVAFGQASSTLRVSKGGQLQFTAGDGFFYQWTAAPASIVIDGTLNIAAPFRGGANQSYRGSGRLNITGRTVSHTASSVVSFGETLQVYPTTWSTVTAGAENRAMAMGANSGTPVIHVTDGWTYGPATDVTPTASANDRAFLLANGAVATIEANGGAVRFVDGVRGFGTLAISNGTLTVEASCAADEVTLAARSGATLELRGEQQIGALETAGATLRLADGAVVTTAKGVDLTDTTLDLGTSFIGSWRTVLIARDGMIVGVPAQDGFHKFRTLETDDGQALQCRSVAGAILFVR